MEPVAATGLRRRPLAVRRRHVLHAIADHSLLLVLAALFLAPFLFVILTALMTRDQALSRDLWPEPFAWNNFIEVFQRSPLIRWALNTAIYAGLATAGLLLSSIPIAYAFSRLRWRGRDTVFVLVLVSMMLPPQITVVSLYILWAKLDLVGTLLPLIVPNWFGDAFSIFLLRQFFLTIPEEYLDAARVDGAGEVRVLTKVVVRSRGRPSRRSRCSRSCSRSTTSSCRCCTRATIRTAGCSRSGCRASGRSTRSTGA